MDAIDFVVITPAAFLTGWFLSALIRIEPESNTWPLIRQFLLVASRNIIFSLGFFCLLYRHSYHHFPSWPALLVSLFVFFAAAAIQVYQREKQERLRISLRPKQHSQTT